MERAWAESPPRLPPAMPTHAPHTCSSPTNLAGTSAPSLETANAEEDEDAAAAVPGNATVVEEK